MEKAPKIAAIDLGTNSFHMAIATINSNGVIKILSREKEMVRLGSSGKDMKYLQEDAIERGIETLYHFSKIAESENAIVRACATSALREAVNRDAFIRRVRNELDINVEIISGAEEGRLIYLGVIHALPLNGKRTLVIDIGGGSTETIIGLDGKTEYIHSEKIGAIRLTKLCCDSGVYDKDTLNQMREYIRGEWAVVLDSISSIGFDTVVGTSGTILTLANMVLASKQQPIPEQLNGLRIDANDILNVIKNLAKKKNTREIARIPGIDPKRADIILAGSLILETAIKVLNIKEIHISPYALREGIVYDTFEKLKSRSEKSYLINLRLETVKELARKYNIDLEHSRIIKNIALKIFDETSEIHKLGVYERELLEYSAYLHDVGYWISHDQHHKNSYYIITHSDLPGFTNDEAEIIGLIARYHRKSHPKKKHQEFSSLSSDKQYAIKVLAGILRIAEGIDRRQKGYVDDVIIEKSKSNGSGLLNIKLLPKNINQSIDIEIWGALRRKLLLEETLSININIF